MPRFSTAIAPTSEGQRLLLEYQAREGLSMRGLAARVERSHQGVRDHALGRKLPRGSTRDRYRDVCTIPIGTWDIKPGASSADTMAGSLAATLNAAAGAAELEGLPDDPSGLPGVIAHTHALSRQPDVTPATAARLLAVETRAIAELERLRSDRAKAAESDAGKALVDDLMKVLDGHPLAQHAAIRWYLQAAERQDRLAEYDSGFARFRARHAPLVDAYEAAAAALAAVYPKDGKTFDAC